MKIVKLRIKWEMSLRDKNTTKEQKQPQPINGSSTQRDGTYTKLCTISVKHGSHTELIKTQKNNNTRLSWDRCKYASG